MGEPAAREWKVPSEKWKVPGLGGLRGMWAGEVGVGDRVILSPYANDTFEWAGHEEHDTDTGVRRPLTYTLCRAEAVQAVIPS
mgnify:CR=1 FL=1